MDVRSSEVDKQARAGAAALVDESGEADVQAEADLDVDGDVQEVLAASTDDSLLDDDELNQR